MAIGSATRLSIAFGRTMRRTALEGACATCEIVRDQLAAMGQDDQAAGADHCARAVRELLIRMDAGDVEREDQDV